MKKKLSVLLAFMMVFTSMCSLVTAADPAAAAGTVEFWVGPQGTEHPNSYAGLAQVYDEKDADVLKAWADGTYTGTFALTVAHKGFEANIKAGQYFVSYDPAVVEPCVVVKQGKTDYVVKTYTEEPTGTVFSASYGMDDVENTTIAAGTGISTEKNVVYATWYNTDVAMDGTKNAVEIGCFAFKTKEGKTVADITASTFAVCTDNAFVQQFSASDRPIQVGENYGISLKAEDQAKLSLAEAKFCIPAKAEKTYNVTVATGIANGTVTVNPTSGKEGTVVTVTATPATGYTLKEITVDGKVITGTTFAIGTKDVVVSATFEEVGGGTPPAPVVDAELTGVSVTGIEAFTFDKATRTYDLKATAADITLSATADTALTVTYSVDGSAFTSTSVAKTLTSGVQATIKVKVSNGTDDAVYTFNVLYTENTDVSGVHSGFEFSGFGTADVYEVEAKAGYAYVRMWLPTPNQVDDKGRVVGVGEVEYAVGNKDDKPEELTYTANAAGCDDREDTFFGEGGKYNVADKPYDANWKNVGFATMWNEASDGTAESVAGKAMFAKLTDVSGNVTYKTVKFQ